MLMVKNHFAINRKLYKSRGFTIVELLIVIVVIAILATISIVSYNGIQQRARNVATISAVSQTKQLIMAYGASFGAYPSTSTACLNSGCGSRNATYDANIAKIGTQATASSQSGLTLDYGGSARMVDGLNVPILLIYYLQGTSQDCGVDGVVKQTGANIYVTTATQPRYTTANSGGSTLCYVSVSVL